MAKRDDSGAATVPSDTAAPASAPADERKAPDAWAEVAFPLDRRGRRTGDFWQHAAASALHGWAEHAHHAGAPIALTAEQYFGALVAASEPARNGKYAPHGAALSPHAPKRTEA